MVETVQAGSSVQASPGGEVCVRGPCVEIAARLFLFILSPVKSPGVLLSKYLLFQGLQTLCIIRKMTIFSREDFTKQLLKYYSYHH